jgi:hypothetical protein
MNEGLQSAENQPSLTVGMSKNTLLVNGRILETPDGPESIQRALTEGRDDIIKGLEDFRDYMQGQHPDAEVSLAPFSVMYFGRARERKRVLTDEALRSREQVYSNIEAIKEEYHPFWRAVEATGFTPEVRAYFFGSAWDVRLWARLPEETGK